MIVAAAGAAPRASRNGEQAGTIRIFRTGDKGRELQIAYAVGGDAEGAKDYQALPGGATIPAGAEEVLITIKPIKAASGRGDKTVVLNLQAGDGYKLGCPATAMVVIKD